MSADNHEDNNTGIQDTGVHDTEVGIARLIEIMAALRTPESGCPWDLVQDFKSIAPYTIEEAYEVADAIDRGNMADLKDELGDLLLQVVYHAQMASEEDAFRLEDVVSCICDKMVRRHPHVFGTHDAGSPDDVSRLWDEIKAIEKAGKSTDRGEHPPENRPASLLDDVPLAFPALTRALKLQNRAARVGFDWPALGPVFDKLEEEMGELSEAVSVGSHEAIVDELGDVLFAVTNLARHLEVDPEVALRAANQKFTGRFQYMECQLAKVGSSPSGATANEMDRLWNEAKKVGEN